MLVNCRNCERAFNQVGPEKLCAPCRETYVKLFQFLSENHEATLEEIERALGLGAKEVRGFLKHGKYVAFEHLNRQLLRCIRCGKPPEHGEFCQDCFEKMVEELTGEREPADGAGDPAPAPKREARH